MKKFLTFVTVAGIMILASGCEIHTRTVYVPTKKTPTMTLMKLPTTHQSLTISAIVTGGATKSVAMITMCKKYG